MTDHDIGNKDPPNPASDLEARLAEVPTLDMDLAQFLVIASWTTYWWEPIREADAEQMREKLEAHYHARRAELPRHIKLRERRFTNAIIGAYCSGTLKTLRELKHTVENKGLHLIRGVGYVGLSHFNKLLRKYGLEPIKVGGKATHDLSQYGLEKATYGV